MRKKTNCIHEVLQTKTIEIRGQIQHQEGMYNVYE